MKLGINLLLFGDAPTPAVLQRFKLLREMGFDGVEVPIFQPDKLDTDRVRRAAERAGLALSTSGALPPGTRFYGPDRAARAAAAAYLKSTIRAAAALGSDVLCGPLYKAVGDTDQSLPLEKQRRETAQALRDSVLPLAEELGVTLAFEPLNRFETNLMNTVEQGIAFCSATKSPRAGLLLDTFHMHIEEKDSAIAIRAAAKAGVLSHFHAAENDRGIAGSGQVHWEAAFRALRAAKYDGWVLLESFNQQNQAIKTAVSCWRPFFPSEREFLKQGLAFVKRMLR
jgi:D-psicose/D-tagatose/L-ribulose 3-epimerase